MDGIWGTQLKSIALTFITLNLLPIFSYISGSDTWSVGREQTKEPAPFVLSEAVWAFSTLPRLGREGTCFLPLGGTFVNAELSSCLFPQPLRIPWLTSRLPYWTCLDGPNSVLSSFLSNVGHLVHLKPSYFLSLSSLSLELWENKPITRQHWISFVL
jgi:hypothetical protein